MSVLIKPAVGLVCGSIFGIGLSVSEMVSPVKVLGFLDIFGNWDPSLAFVMGGALIVAAVSFRIISRRPAPQLMTSFDLPTKVHIDIRLLVGAVMFGIGWGLVGLCPGPALANLAIGLASESFKPLIFVAAMITGMLVQGKWRP